MTLAGLRHRLRPCKIAAAVKALRDEKLTALAPLKERRARERYGHKKIAVRTETVTERLVAARLWMCIFSIRLEG
jgi:hypothetical protein